MKSSNNIFTFLFVLVVVGLIAGAVYILYYSQNIPNVDEEETEEVTETQDVISVVGNLKMGISNYDTMNPLLSHNKEILNIDKIIFEPLVNVTSDFNTEKCLADSIERNSDTEYVIKTNSSIKWQDGSSFISKDVQFTIEKLKELDSIYSSNVRAIESVETPDSETVVIKLSYGVPFFEYYLDFPILPSAYYMNEDFSNTDKIPIGTGMYKIASIDDDNIFLTRNDRWRNSKNSTPKTESITIHKSGSIGEIFNSFKLGNIDIINTNLPNYTDYVGTMGYNKIEYPGREYTFLSLNCNDSILGLKEVRQAINQAINRENIVSSIFGGNRIASYSPLDYGSCLYNRDLRINVNQDNAKKTLEDNNWVYSNEKWQKNIDGYVRKLNISMVVDESNEERMNVASNIQSQLKDIGITVNIAKVSNERYYQYLNEKNYQMILTGVTTPIAPNQEYFYGNDNIANYNNDDVKSKLYATDHFDELEKQVVEDSPYVGLYRTRGAVILNANVGGNFKSNNYFTYYNFNEWFRQQ